MTEKYYQTRYQSPLGEVILACDGEEKHIVGLWFAGQKYLLGTLPETPAVKENIPVLQMAKEWLDAYFAKKKPAVTELPLSPIGSAFRQEVWRMLREIPYGSVTTYGEIARKMGRKTMSAQAVGGAVAHNPISVIIPCHRVVGAGGSLTGYAGGIDKKMKLLAHEGVDISLYSMY